MEKKVLIAYVFSKYDNIERLQDFVNHYKKYESGLPHKLLICFKLMDDNNLIKCREILKDINYFEYIDKTLINDYEFKTMERAVQPYKDYLILFLISHCQPNKKDWLKILISSYEKNSFVGVSGSNESMFTSFKMKKIWKIFYNLNNFFFFKKNFNKFPNPHIRLPAFLLKQCDYLRFVKNRHYDSKKSAWITESGKNSMTAYFKEIGFNIYIVNSDKKRFSLNDMKESETYSYKNQNKVLISDRHIRNYLNFDISKKKLVEKRNWG